MTPRKPVSRPAFNMRYLPVVFFLLVAIALGGVILRKLPADSPQAEISGENLIGKQLPVLDLPTFAETDADARFTSPSLLAERRPVLLNIFASWCPGCKQEHALLNELATVRGWPIYGIAWKDTLQGLTTYLARNGNPYRMIGLDPHGDAMMQLGATGTPETYVIGVNGKILYVHRGVITEQMAQQHIAPLMEQKNAGAVQ